MRLAGASHPAGRTSWMYFAHSFKITTSPGMGRVWLLCPFGATRATPCGFRATPCAFSVLLSAADQRRTWAQHAAEVHLSLL